MAVGERFTSNSKKLQSLLALENLRQRHGVLLDLADEKASCSERKMCEARGPGHANDSFPIPCFDEHAASYAVVIQTHLIA
jgi:hypothetical protein